MVGGRWRESRIGADCAGHLDHRKVDRYGGAPDADSFQAVNIRHEGWGVSGRLDAARMTDEGIVIREYKATPVKRAMQVTEAMRTQLACRRLVWKIWGLPLQALKFLHYAPSSCRSRA